MDLIRKTFENSDIRVAIVDDVPWFVAKDVCEYFQDSNHKRSVSRIEDEDKTYIDVIDSLGRPQKATAVNESGLYTLLFNFQPQKANKDGGTHNELHLQDRIHKLKSFKKWVTSEVLPSIRKHGAYMAPNTIERALTDPDFLIELATKLKEERLKREQIEKEKQKLEEERLKALPKIQVFDSIINQDGLFSIRNTAKTLQVPERKFIEFLMEKKIIFRNPQGHLEPYSTTISKGFMEIKLVETEKAGAKSQAKFTAKGQAWISLLADKYFSTALV